MIDFDPEGFARNMRKATTELEVRLAQVELERIDSLHPDECVIHGGSEGRKACCNRIDHPTPTSDCTTGRPIRHITEAAR